MENNFKKDLEIAKRKDINKLIKLYDVLRKNEKRVYRGEVNVIDSKNNILSQTHYEFFTLILSKNLIVIQRYNNKGSIEELDYTNVNADKITDYKITSTSLTLIGEFSQNVKIKILAVFLDK